MGNSGEPTVVIVIETVRPAAPVPDPPTPPAPPTPHAPSAADLHVGSPGGSVPDDRGAITRTWLAEGRRQWLEKIPGWVDPGWFSAPVRRDVRALLGLEPGPELLAAVAPFGRDGRCPADHTAECDPWERGSGRTQPGSPGRPCACQVVIVAAWAAALSWVEAQNARVQVGAARLEPVHPDPDQGRPVVVDPAVEELAVATRTTPVGARNRVDAARRLVRQPALLGLVERGYCSAGTARLLLQDFRYVADEEVESILAVVAERTSRRCHSGRRPWTGTEIRQCARRVAATRDIRWRRVRERALQDRCVQVFAASPGMARVVATIRDVDAHRIANRLTAIARCLTDPHDNRTLEQKRADVLVDVLIDPPDPVDPADQPTSGPAAGTAVSVDVIIDAATLLGLAEHPAEMPGVGPIPADIARELAADSRWRLWLVDSATRQVVATSPRTYRPTAALARLIRAREPVCRMPGCRRSSAAVDLDHVIPWPRGATTEGNLGPLCRRHHNLKTHYGWQIDPAAGGGWVWVTPAGVRIQEEPDPPLTELP